jgi:hypothetical protein
MTEEQMIALINPRTRESKDLFTRHFSELPNELSLIVLKGHLLVEVSLTAVISHYAQPSADIAKVGLRFAQKVALVKALAPSVFFPPGFWDFVHLLNHLRNDFAHQLEPRKMEEHLELMRTMFSVRQKSLGWESYPTDEAKLGMLISLWLGVLDPLNAFVHAMEKSKVYATDLQKLAQILREQCQEWPDSGNA